jgi:hypothetical protein
MMLRLRVQHEPQAPAAGPVTTIVSAHAAPSPAALGLSLAIHLVGIPLLPLWFLQPAAPRGEPVTAQLLSPEVTRVILRLPPRSIAFQSASPAGSASGRPLVPLPASAPNQARPGVAQRPSPFLLRPMVPVEVRQSIRDLASIAAWTGDLPAPPEPVSPGAAKPVPPAPLPVTEASAAPPVEAANAGPVPIPHPKPARARMTLPSASPSPVTLLATGEDLALTAPPGASQQGMPVAVISISGILPKPGEAILVPDRSSLPPEPAGKDGLGTGTKTASANPAELKNSEDASSGDAAGRSGSSPATEANPSVSTQTLAVSARSGPGGASSESLSPSANGGKGGSANPVRSYTVPLTNGVIQVAEWGDGSRHLRYPENGSFDVVVVGTGSPAGLPAAESLLSGRPIYTAYIQVGTSREWILQFCVASPARKASMPAGMVVNLGAEARLEPPYVQFAQLPAFPGSKEQKYLAIRFNITSDGAVKDPRPVSGVSSGDSGLVSMLASWEFRPAAREGENLPIEAVLIVPPGPFVR